MASQSSAEQATAPSTADRILDAAEDLFAVKGYSATSLGDVADRVGIRSPSLYNQFRKDYQATGSGQQQLVGERLAHPIAQGQKQQGQARLLAKSLL